MGKQLRAIFALVALATSLHFISTDAHAGATITIRNDDSPGEGFNDNTGASPVGGNTETTVGAQRLRVFERAAEIWGARLDSSVDIIVASQFNPLPCTANSGVLGAAGPTFVESDFAAGILSSTWYVVAQANAIAGSDLEPGAPHISATFQSNVGMTGCLENGEWYYGLDGNNTGGGQIDLLATVLHELGHGLGFLSLVDESTGQLGFNQIDVFSTFLRDNEIGKSWPQMSNAERVASAINAPDLVWTGSDVSSAAPGFLDVDAVLEVSSPAPVAGVYRTAPATFGPTPSLGGISGDLVLVDDPIATASDACSPITNGVQLIGNIAVIDRGGCPFTTKVKNAQNAGATAAIVINNEAGPPEVMGGSDNTITIPSVMISQSDGNALKAQLGAGVSAELRTDNSFLTGADNQNRPRMHAPSPVEPGSSVSHWSTAATPDLLMEPFISASLTDEVDLTLELFRDIGWPIPSVPVAAVTQMSARRDAGGVTLQWSGAALERGGLEFHVYRTVDGGRRTQLSTAALGPANEYEFIDTEAPEQALEYWLQVNWPGGTEDWVGPLAVAPVTGAGLFRFSAPSPNPFREASALRFSLPASGTVNASVHDLRGRLVRMLTAGNLDAGSHQLIWDGLSDTGAAVASGVYFAQVEFEGRRQVQKITVAR